MGVPVSSAFNRGPGNIWGKKKIIKLPHSLFEVFPASQEEQFIILEFKMGRKAFK